MSCCQHGFLWHSHAICLYHPYVPAGLLDYILCLYRAVVDKFLLVVQYSHIRVKRSIGERRLWVRRYYSSSVLHVLFILFGWFQRWEVGGCTATVLWVSYFQDLFNTVSSILMQFPSGFFFIRFVSVYVVHPYSRIDTTAAWEKLCFILSDFCMIDNLSIAVYAFASRIFMSLLVEAGELVN